jgi:hypothetical protein
MTIFTIVKLISSHKQKRFFRSAAFTQKIIGRIFLFLFLIYFAGLFYFLGYNLDSILNKIYPNKPTHFIINKYILSFMLIFMAARFFMQKLPKVNLTPYFHLPISKNKLTLVYLLFFFFKFQNFFHLFIILPYWVKK